MLRSITRFSHHSLQFYNFHKKKTFIDLINEFFSLMRSMAMCDLMPYVQMLLTKAMEEAWNGD